MERAGQVLLVAGVEQALQVAGAEQAAPQGMGEGEEVPLGGREVEEGPLLLQTMELVGG